MRVRSVAATVLAVALVGGVWTVAIRALTSRSTPPPSAAPNAVVWGERVFSTPAAFRGWIRSRGASYARWVRRHPTAVSILLGRPIPRRQQTPHVTREVAATAPTVPRSPSADASSSIAYSALFALLLAAGSALLLLPLIPVELRRRSGLVAWISPERRPYALMAGISLLVGCGLATHLP